MKKLLVMLLAALMLVSASACTAEVDDTLSTVQLDKTEVDNSFVSGTETFYYVYVNSDSVAVTNFKSTNNTPHEVVIPSEMNGKTVVGIADRGVKDSEQVFANKSNVSAVVIPATVTSIGSQAFVGCDALTRVVIPASLQEIGASAFAFCDQLETVTFTGETAKLTAIAKSVFHGCVSLDSINLPASVTEIGDDAFYGCVALETLTLPNGLEKLGADAFAECSTLEAITIPQSVVYCGAGVFARCDANVTFANADGWYAVKNHGAQDEERIAVDVSTVESAADVFYKYHNDTLIKQV